MSNFTLIQQFHEKFDPPMNEDYTTLLPRRLAYLLEEVQEAAEAADNLFSATDPAGNHPAADIKQAKAALIKELTDVLHVTYGFLHLLNVDADAAFTEVHASNMTKTPEPGGKAVKGAGYAKADMEQFV